MVIVNFLISSTTPLPKPYAFSFFCFLNRGVGVEEVMKRFIGKFITWQGWPKLKDNILTVLIVATGLCIVTYVVSMVLMSAYLMMVATVAAAKGAGGWKLIVLMIGLWWLVLDLMVMFIGANFNEKFRIWLGGTSASPRDCNTVTGTLVRKGWKRFYAVMKSWAKGDQ